MKNIKRLKSLYNKSKSAKVGEKCLCPSCETEFIKENYQQAFCKTRSGTICKDAYWNNVIPNKRNNTTRIFPANKQWQNAYLEKPEIYGRGGYDPDEHEHPFSSEALGQW